MEQRLVDENMRLLEEQVRKGGFPGEVLHEMRERISEGTDPALYLGFTGNVDGNALKGSLYLQRSPDQRTYKLLSLHLHAAENQRSVWSFNIFSLNPLYAVTLRQANNLMQGRSIYREPLTDPQAKGYWVSLNRQVQKMEHARLDYIPSEFRAEKGIADAGLVAYLKPVERSALAEALKQGDRRELSIDVMGMTRKIWAEAAPGFGVIHLSDARGKAVQLQDLTVGQKPDEMSFGLGKGRSR